MLIVSYLINVVRKEQMRKKFEVWEGIETRINSIVLL
jgi:hypothetical protein